MSVHVESVNLQSAAQLPDVCDLAPFGGSEVHGQTLV